MEHPKIYSTKLLTKFYPDVKAYGKHGKPSFPKTGDGLHAGKLLTVKEARSAERTKSGSRR